MASLVFADQPGQWHAVDFPKNTLTKVSWDSSPDTAIAYVFFGYVNLDFDGCPTAYATPDAQLAPLDDLKNAGNEGQGWYAIATMKPTDKLVSDGTVVIDTDPSRQYHGLSPVIQQDGDPAPGYYVSTLPPPCLSGPPYLQRSYIDSSQVAIGAFSAGLKNLGFGFGDYGLAIRHDKQLQSGFFFADRGNGYGLGECSSKVGDSLGGSWQGTRYYNDFPVSFITFPGSHTVDQSHLPSMSDTDIGNDLRPLLANLATADNAADLVYLMGLNETSPDAHTVPQGLAKITALQAQPSNPKPRHAGTILQGLQAFGYAVSIAMKDGAFSDDTVLDTAAVDDGTSETRVAEADPSSPSEITPTTTADVVEDSTPSPTG